MLMRAVELPREISVGEARDGHSVGHRTLHRRLELVAALLRRSDCEVIGVCAECSNADEAMVHLAGDELLAELLCRHKWLREPREVLRLDGTRCLVANDAPDDLPAFDIAARDSRVVRKCWLDEIAKARAHRCLRREDHLVDVVGTELELSEVVGHPNLDSREELRRGQQIAPPYQVLDRERCRSRLSLSCAVLVLVARGPESDLGEADHEHSEAFHPTTLAAIDAELATGGVR